METSTSHVNPDIGEDEEGEQLHDVQRSLLDILKETIASEGRETMIARVLYVGQLPDKHSRTRIVEYHSALLARCRQETEGEFTGLLLVWETCFLHLVEAPLTHLQVLLDHVKDGAASGEAPVVSARIASFMDDCEQRAFSFWDASPLSAAVADEIEAVPYSDAAEYMSEVGIQMLQLGKQLSGIASQEKLKTAINKLATFATDLPSPDRVTAMSMSDDLLSLAEFLEVFSKPVHLELDTDVVWPIPRSVAV